MTAGSVSVLLITGSVDTSIHIRASLERRGFLCRVARSIEESILFCNRHSFQLILSTVWLKQSDPQFARLMKSNAKIFFSYPVRNSCWWLPVALNGRRVLGSSGFRPGEFGSALDRLVREIRLAGSIAAVETTRYEVEDDIPSILCVTPFRASLAVA